MGSMQLGSHGSVPVDFFGDPDGLWEYEALVAAAGLRSAEGPVAIGALTRPYKGFPEGAAVVQGLREGRLAVALVDCVSGGGTATAGEAVGA